ncbi:MAG: ribosomal RNA small subunit methyltransferase A, partial [Chloroflexota bacterium]
VGADGTAAIRLVEDNALDVPTDELIEAPWKLVANLPYHITSPVLHHVLEPEPRPERFVLMVQREVAERIAAQPGAMSYLSVFVQVHARARVAFRVPREAFEPAPKVESAVLVLETYDPLAPPAADEDDLWRLVQAGFRERRKMIRNVLARQLPVPASRVEDALAEVGIAGDRRPQTLSVEDWRRLQPALGPLPAR